MTEPTFSVCIPNYNYARYVGETIRSVLDQTYPHFEVVVVDNASTDASLDVIRSFHDPRIRVFANRYNIGFAPNLQKATAYARNEYLNLLSADDVMRPDALERYARALADRGDRAGSTVLFSDAEVIDGDGRPTGRFQRSLADFPDLPPLCEDPSGGRVYRGREVLARALGRLRSPAPFLTVTYPRALWEAVEGYNAVRTIGPDKYFNYKLLACDPDVVYVPAPLFGYRVHGSPNTQASQATLKQQIDDYLNTIEFSDTALAELGLTRDGLVREFLDRVCLRAALSQLAHNSYPAAVRAWAFALASYPGCALRRPGFYSIAGLLALGPLARPFARAAYRLTRGTPA